MNLKYLFLSLFLSVALGTNFHAQTDRCGVVEYMEQQIQNDPGISVKMQEIEKHTKAHVHGEKSISGVITIPVVFHLVYNPASSTQNISDAQILSQLDVLNEDFRRMNADAANTPEDFLGVASDVEIEFCLATVDPFGNPTTGITRTETVRNFFAFPNQANEIKSHATGGKDAWPTSDYLNIWIGSVSGALGYAPYPGGDPAYDGVVLHYRYTGRGGTAASLYALGRTGTHEVGHWLNLRHIWGDGNCSVDDLVSDTPTASGPNGTGAPCTYPGRNSCDDGQGDLPDMFQNYMDYSLDVCMNLFTHGQTDRMRVLFEPGGPRASLLNSNGCGIPTPCVVAIDNVTLTDESCPGSNDGSITVSASCTTCGSLEYSIDGVNYQTGNSFSDLIPGSYNITVRSQNNPTCMTVYAQNPVVLNHSTVTLQTLYKDADDDGYTDGNTIFDCPQPGYKLQSELASTFLTDCDDNDPHAFPGQTWYKDADNDNYSNGTTTTSCLRPAGYKAAGELNGTNNDCNDNNAATNPGAAEICDGQDNNCNGTVDEDAPGGQAYVGNVMFTNQAQINAWPSCYGSITGNLTIQGSSINNLGPLSNISSVTGNVVIMVNTSLTTLSGLDGLSTVGGSFNMYYNFNLSNCCAIDDLLTNGGVGGSKVIFYNKAGSHCNSAAAIMAACPIVPLVANPNGNTTIGQAATLQAGKTMALFPNPARNEVQVRFDRKAPVATLRIMDLLGRTVFEMELEEGMDQLTIDLNSGQFENGIYLVSLFEDGEMTTKQLVVQQ